MDACSQWLYEYTSKNPKEKSGFSHRNQSTIISDMITNQNGIVLQNEVPLVSTLDI